MSAVPDGGAPARGRAEAGPPAPAKWRPSLWQISTLVLGTAACLPLVGLFFLRTVEDQMIRATEGELIAQSAVLAAVMAAELRAAPGALVPGAVVAEDARPPALGGFRPVEPRLSLASDPVLPDRPPARAPAEPPGGAARALGTRVAALALEAQRTTLAGFRILDAEGRVIGGQGDVGGSFAHVEEVAAALEGRHASALRLREPDRPPPPVYSLSRGTTVRVFTAVPVIVGGRVVGAIHASRTPNNVVKYFYAERDRLLAAALTVAAVTLLLGAVFARLVNRPVAELIARTERIDRGDRTAFRALRWHGTREIARLADRFMGMAERLDRRSRHVSTFTAHVTHALKGPLAAIRGAAELMRESPEMAPADRDRLLGRIGGASDRIARLLARLRELARAEGLEPGGPCRIGEALDAVGVAPPGLAIVAEGETGAALPISAESLGIVLHHIAENAAQHGASRLSVAVAVAEDARLTLRDDGRGVSEGNRARVFEPFFTTRAEGGGTGVGLQIVRALLETHGGTIRLLPEGPGAAFEIRFPRAPL